MDEMSRLAELIPNAIQPQSLPFTDVGDLFNFIGLMVVGGFLIGWIFWKLLLCLWYEIKHWRK